MKTSEWGCMTRVVYDSCVLFPASLRDLLLNLAYFEVVSARWSDRIQDEWINNLLRKRPDLRPENLDRTRQQMKVHFGNGLVTGYEYLIDSLSLPDPNDRHVLAVAIHCGADGIVTNNLSDFPQEAMAPHGIQAFSPDDFIVKLVERKTDKVLAAMAFHRSTLKRPPKTIDQYLETLRRHGLTKTVAFLEEHRSEI